MVKNEIEMSFLEFFHGETWREFQLGERKEVVILFFLLFKILQN